MKVLLDVNILDEELITKFKENNILDLVESNKITFFLSNILLLQKFVPYYNYDKTANKENYYNLLNFLLKLCDDRIFDDSCQIVMKEFNNKARKGKYCYINCAKAKELKKEFLEQDITYLKDFFSKANEFKKNLVTIADNDSQKLFNKIQPILDKNYDEYLVLLKNIFTEQNYSIEIIDAIDSVNKYLHGSSDTRKHFLEVLKIRIEYLITRLFIIQTLNLGRDCILNYVDNPINYPYTQKRIQSYTFLLTRKLEAQILKKDIPSKDNDAIFDNEYICLMQDLDVLLTNDESYMKDCFDYIYGNNKKQILTLDNFLEYIKEFKTS